MYLQKKCPPGSEQLDVLEFEKGEEDTVSPIEMNRVMEKMGKFQTSPDSLQKKTSER